MGAGSNSLTFGEMITLTLLTRFDRVFEVSGLVAAADRESSRNDKTYAGVLTENMTAER
jgi:hypothetical protein